MKILIMGFTKLKYMPYINCYLDNIAIKRNEVHLLYWNRDKKSEDVSLYQWVTLHEFSCYQGDEVAKWNKMGNFLTYRRFVKKVLRENKFDFIIVLHTLPGILIFDKLIRDYANRYILDYRDSTYEENPVFRKMVHTLVYNAKKTFVSSDAFRKYLPQDTDIFTSHNLLLDSLQHRNEKLDYGQPSDKIRIAFWGFIRHESINKELIKKLCGDGRFELHFYGREQETAKNLKKYTYTLGANNVYFHGEYKPEDRYEFVRHTDIIHNIYYDSNTMIAMGNKYYDGILFYLPQLCIAGSYMGDCIEKNKVGFACNPFSEDFTVQLYQYYQSIVWDVFRNNCDIALRHVLNDYQEVQQVIYDSLEK